VLILPDHNAFVSSGDPTLIPRMFRDSAMSFGVTRLSDEVATAVLESDKRRPLGQLIYCAALFGSEGRLVLNSSPGDELSLVEMPDFDAVPHLPEHRAIARHMIDHPGDLAAIAVSTGVSINVVIDFCNACEAVGLVRRAGAGGSTTGERRVMQLFDRMRDLFRET
jgi:hypothetical protein